MTCIQTSEKITFILSFQSSFNCNISHYPLYRHQTTGAVIARCGQPEVSWWGWRNADDEHLVQSIAKACAVDSSSRKHLSNGGYTNGHDLSDTDFGESSDSSPHTRYTSTQIFMSACDQSDLFRLV